MHELCWKIFIFRGHRIFLLSFSYFSVQNKVVLNVEARDGDVNNLRSISFSLEEETLGYFSLQNHGNGNASLVTTDKQIDRENPVIVQMGGIYTFFVKVSHHLK